MYFYLSITGTICQNYDCCNLKFIYFTGICRLDEDKYINKDKKMFIPVSSLGVCCFLVSCYFPCPYATPLPSWNLNQGHRSIHGLPVIRRAFSTIRPSGGEGLDTVHGTVFLEETEEGVFITGSIHGLKPGLHGFHVHKDGNLDNACKASGGHFNPAGVSKINLSSS